MPSLPIGSPTIGSSLPGTIPTTDSFRNLTYPSRASFSLSWEARTHHPNEGS
jgi:hypothetical protein